MFKLLIISALAVSCQAAPSPDHSASLPSYAPGGQLHHAHAGSHHHEASIEKEVVDESPKQFSYGYEVQDAETNSNFQAQQEQDTAGVVLGSYKIALPDGRTQTVTYKADPVEGFKAEVTFEGEAQYPEETSSKPSHSENDLPKYV